MAGYGLTRENGGSRYANLNVKVKIKSKMLFSVLSQKRGREMKNGEIVRNFFFNSFKKKNNLKSKNYYIFS